MATTLGKRKRRAVNPAEGERENDRKGSGSFEEDAQEIFRRHFEAQFKPLPVIERAKKVEDEGSEDESGDESAWEGISDYEEHSVQVIEHQYAQSRIAAMSKEEVKSFMSSKPPKAAAETNYLSTKAGMGTAAGGDEDDPSEAANLKKDLALQRLLTESHLLDSSTSPTLSGSNRHKATDLRLQALGSKTSIFAQQKMPMAHRKGMLAKQSEREQTRRKEARENGIILEKARMGGAGGGKKTQDGGRRDRGIGGPGVGRFSSGMLKLSKKDIFDIEGPERRTTAGRGRGGRGRGKGK